MKIRKKDGSILEIIYSEKQLFNYGLNRLSGRDYGRIELQRKMLRLQPDVSMVDGVLDRLETMGYLSDQRRLQAVFNQYQGRESAQKTTQRLMEKGFSKTAIEDFIQERNAGRTTEEQEDQEIRTACDQLSKKWREGYEDIPKDKKTRFLVSRGFSFDVIRKALKYRWDPFLEESGTDVF